MELAITVAVRNNCADVIKAYGKLFQLLHEKERGQLFELLEATSADSCLYQQLNIGNKEVNEVYKKLRQLVLT